MNAENRSRSNALYITLVFATGITALVFQNTWHRYLTYLLGSQSQATAIIISVFLGGMSAGYFLYGHLTRKFRMQLFKLYGVTEFLIGIWAIFSPRIYQALIDVPVSSFLMEIVVALIFFGVPTVLMGGTLPVLTQALSKDVHSATKTHSRIYGFNTFGAAMGSLLAGFVLLPVLGLPLTLFFAGLINLIVGGVFYSLGAIQGSPEQPTSESSSIYAEGKKPSHATSSGEGKRRWLWGVAFISGFVTIGLETLMIRLFGLSAGSSSYSFSVIIAIFIFCIAFGGYLVGKIKSLPPCSILILLLANGFTLIALFCSVETWPYYAHVIRTYFSQTPPAFWAYHSTLFLILGLVLLIPISLCGATLPLCFHLAKREQSGLGSETGNLYAINTLGCVMGSMLAGYYLLYAYDLNQVFLFLIFLVGLSALFSLYKLWSSLGSRQRAVFSGVCLLLLLTVLRQPLWDNQYFTIGLFRFPTPIANTFKGYEAMRWPYPRFYYSDGPAATVSVTYEEFFKNKKKQPALAVQINAKTDGSTFHDFYTQQLSAHIPLLFTEHPKNACIVGFGTGMTAGVITQYSEVERLDLIEINPMILEAGRLFERFNYRVLSNPKTHVVGTDAFRFFRSNDQVYDVIISEPSNPWMAGVENVFSKEFYELVHQHLHEKGRFLQWFHGYSLSVDTLRLILNTYRSVFPYAYVFQFMRHDYGILGSKQPITKESLQLFEKKFRAEQNNPALKDLGFQGIEQFLSLERISGNALDEFSEYGGVHTLENPKLGYWAGRNLFTSSTTNVIHIGRNNPMATPGVALLNQWQSNMKKPVPVSLPEDLCGSIPLTCAILNLRNFFLDPNTVESKFYFESQNGRDRKILNYLIGGQVPVSNDSFDRKQLLKEIRRHALRHYSANRLVGMEKHLKLIHQLGSQS